MVRILARDVLRGQPTMATSNVDEAHAKIAELFCSHELAPRTRASLMDMKLRSLHRGDVGIEFLDYGADVRIEPEGLQDFHLVQIPAGRTRFHAGGCQHRGIQSPHGHGSAYRPPIFHELGRRQSAPDRLRAALRAGAGGRAVYGDSAVDLGYGMDLSGAAGRAFLRSVVELHDDMISQPRTTAPAFVQGLLADSMVSRLLMAMELPGGETRDAESESRLVRECRELLERHAFEELTVPDIAECLGVSVRTLQTALRAETGATPSELLRSIRLDRAREMLLEANPREQSVTAVAELCGFTHQGRFSALYVKAFGELPSESLRR